MMQTAARKMAAPKATRSRMKAARRQGVAPGSGASTVPASARERTHRLRRVLHLLLGRHHHLSRSRGSIRTLMKSTRMLTMTKLRAISSVAACTTGMSRAVIES